MAIEQRQRGDKANHTLKPLYRKKKGFAPTLIGYECLVHGEIMTPSLQLSEDGRMRRKGKNDAHFIKSKIHKARLKAAKRKKKKDASESDPESRSD